MKNLLNYYNLIKDKKYRQMTKYYAHGNISVFRHSLLVTLCCLKLNKMFGLKAKLNVLIPAALLHDLYLYDWHKKEDAVKLRGFNHPKIASKNAMTYFNVDRDVAKCIMTHMWPLTITKIPTTKEAMILCVADKICAFMETFGLIKTKRKHSNK